MLRDKLIYIFLLVSFCSFGQSKMLQASIQQASGGAAPSELYPFDDAAGPNNTNAAPDAGWSDVYSNGSATESVESDGSGGYRLKFEISNTSNYRPYFLVELEAGVVYDYVIEGLANASSQVRIIDPQIPGGAYANISSQPFLTASNATYNLTLSPSTTGTYRIQYNFQSPSSGDWLALRKVSIIAQ